jgi:hypothetical protein
MLQSPPFPSNDQGFVRLPSMGKQLSCCPVVVASVGWIGIVVSE